MTKCWFIDPPQIAALAAAIGDQHSLLVKTAAYTGLRAGELQALRVRRVDLDKRTLDVVNSLSEVRGKLFFVETKTYSRRQVGVPEALAAELAEHIEARSLGPDDLVFAGQRSGPMRHNSFYSRLFKPAVRRSGVPDGFASMISGTRARRCSSRRAPTRGRSWSDSATPPSSRPRSLRPPLPRHPNRAHRRPRPPVLQRGGVSMRRHPDDLSQAASTFEEGSSWRSGSERS